RHANDEHWRQPISHIPTALTEALTLPAEPEKPGADLREAAPRAEPHVRIRASSGWRALNLVELWRYPELIYFLALRDIKVRYKQSALGVAWAVLQPLLTMAVFTLFFGVLARIPSEGAPYALFVLVALLPWQLFAYALTQSSNSLVTEQRLI